MNAENSNPLILFPALVGGKGCGRVHSGLLMCLQFAVIHSVWFWTFTGLLTIRLFAAAADGEILVDFEQAEIGKPVTNWVERGVTFTLAHQPRQSRAPGRVMFFPHLATNRKGILCAMATEQIPVQARFPAGAAMVRLRLWGSTGCPALLEAFDANGRVVDKASVPAVPGRTRPEDPIPFFDLTVKSDHITHIQFSGPRTGEFLAVDELRFVPASTPPR